MSRRLSTRTSRAAAGLLLGVLVAAASACGSGRTAPGGQAAADVAGGRQLVDVAVGASETVGAGIGDDRDRATGSWPQLVFNEALPRAALLYNLGIPGATVAQALDDELPQALALHPDVVTVWLNVDDLVAGVSAVDYEASLDRLVAGLRAAGRTRVLVANTPVLRDLPAYLACRPGAPAGSTCQLGGHALLPPPDAVDAAVAAYNAAIARVCAHRGATLIDLHAQGDVALTMPDLVSDDGFHPSALGHRAVAALFVRALRAAPLR